LRIKRTDADKTFEPLKSNVSESELPDYIGKDLAQKIIEEGSGSRDFSKVYSGLDLQVGGSDLVSTKMTQWSSSVDDRLLSRVIHNV
jgi:hypothetical protein